MTTKNASIWTAQHRAALRETCRGRDLYNGKFRNFCCRCGLPLEVALPFAEKKDLCCDDCAAARVRYDGPARAGPERPKRDAEGDIDA